MIISKLIFKHKNLSKALLYIDIRTLQKSKKHIVVIIHIYGARAIFIISMISKTPYLPMVKYK